MTAHPSGILSSSSLLFRLAAASSSLSFSSVTDSDLPATSDQHKRKIERHFNDLQQVRRPDFHATSAPGMAHPAIRLCNPAIAEHIGLIFGHSCQKNEGKTAALAKFKKPAAEH